MKLLQRAHEQLHVIILARHQVATTKVNPLQLTEPAREFLLNMRQRAHKHIAARLAVAMNVEALHVGRQLTGQILRQDAKT